MCFTLLYEIEIKKPFIHHFSKQYTFSKCSAPSYMKSKSKSHLSLTSLHRKCLNPPSYMNLESKSHLSITFVCPYQPLFRSPAPNIQDICPYQPLYGWSPPNKFIIRVVFYFHPYPTVFGMKNQKFISFPKCMNPKNIKAPPLFKWLAPNIEKIQSWRVYKFWT